MIHHHNYYDKSDNISISISLIVNSNMVLILTLAVQRWKEGKRRAEKDPHVGANFFKLISPDIECPGDAYVPCPSFRQSYHSAAEGILDRRLEVDFLSKHT